MKALFKDLTVRHPRLEDAVAVHALLTAREIANHGEPDDSLEDVLAEWKDINLDEDAWLVYAQENLVGYAAVSEENEGYFFDWYTHPDYTAEGLEAQLLAQVEARAREKLASKEGMEEARLWFFISEVDKASKEAVQAASYQAHKYYFRMQIHSQVEPSNSRWPEGSELRTIVPGEDDKKIYDFIYSEFDWEGRGSNQTIIKWREFMMRADHFVPELWFLLEQKDEIIAAALCYDYPENGWVRQLAVKNSLRRQGIGTEMLKHVFRMFYQRGQARVALVVDSGNPKAQNFYKNVGMYLERQHIEYDKTIHNTNDSEREK